ncbi:MAG: hypothetical protein HWN65_14885 [Candidatus Helarchaeota archaeon]|nr:hypothetical protein [Candidatus Helarchaeota archaeon]
MVSAKENTNVDEILNNLMRPQPILVTAPPECYQDGKTFRKSRFDCIACDCFDSCSQLY